MAVVNHVNLVAGSLIFADNMLDMDLTKYAKVTFSSPAGDISRNLPAYGQVTHPISGAIDQVEVETKDGLKEMFVFQTDIITLGSGCTVSVTG